MRQIPLRLRAMEPINTVCLLSAPSRCSASARRHMQNRAARGGCARARPFLRKLGLCDRVGEDAEDGDRRAERAGERERVVEVDDRHDDHGDALDRVGDGVRDGVDGREGEERALVVQVVRHARIQQHAHKAPQADHFDGLRGALDNGAALDEQREWCDHGERDQREHAIEVLCVHVGANRRRHDALGGDGAQCKRDVGGEAREEGDGGERDLACGRDGDASDDRQQ
mmetsp:Transcript_740/g.1902  ORF Transcript_740/g.1902 Transcript_740/m.1902 type:complete len:227 (-) Transcript_740:583-1263(-)